VFDNLASTQPGTAVAAVGAVPTLIGLVWGFVIGFHPSQLPVLLVLLLVGVGLLTVGQKMREAAKRNIALAQIAARDAAKGGE
jgi:hypothetical protein